MSQEIIYTSSPVGLRPGSFGFCTVATTPGMATSLAERLESLSGYRHVFPPDHPQAAHNPVVFSHLLLKVGGQRLHVLSRIADAGLDYSQRTNKLAHHVALDANELVPAGPAWVLGQPGFAQTEWSGSPRILATGRKPPSASLSPQVCHAWQRAVGDAGWAGVLAQHALDGKRPAHLIFPEGLDVLSLLVEAQSLLPPARRWEVSFSTYFTRLPSGVECLWRCVLAGSPEADSAAGMRGELVIDLTHNLGPARDGPLVDAARTGKLPAESISPPATSGTLELAVSPEVAPAPIRHRMTGDELRVAPPPLPRSGKATTASVGHGANTLPSAQRTRRLSWPIMPLSTAVAFLLCTTIGLGILLVRERERRILAEQRLGSSDISPQAQSPPVTVQQQVTSKEVPADSNATTQPEDGKSPPPANVPLNNAAKRDTPKPATASPGAADADPVAVKRIPAATGSPAKTAPGVAPSPNSGPENPDSKSPSFDPQRVTPVDRQYRRPATGPNKRSEPASFATLGEHIDLANLAITLIGNAGTDETLQLVRELDSGTPTWVVQKGPLGNKPIAQPTKLAVFRPVNDGSTLTLAFEWLPTAESAMNSRNILTSSLLSISQGSGTAKELPIGEPISISPIRHVGLKFEAQIPSSPFQGIRKEEIKLDNVDVRFSMNDEHVSWNRGASTATNHQYVWSEDPNLVLDVTLDIEEAKVRAYFYYRLAEKDRERIDAAQISSLRTQIEFVSTWKGQYDQAEAEIASIKAELQKLMGKDASRAEKQRRIATLDKLRDQALPNIEKVKKSMPKLLNDRYRNALTSIQRYLDDGGEIEIACSVSRIIGKGNDKVIPVAIVTSTVPADK